MTADGAAFHDMRQLRRRLCAWYVRHHRHLPWRSTSDPYAIWVSEVMLQQTQVHTVIPFYRRFMRRFPEIHILATADLQTVLKCWEGLGYYARARNLHHAAGRVCRQFGGRLPDDWQGMISLPGVGDYIAAAVLSIAYARPYAVVDGNVKRMLARFLAINAPVNQARSAPVFRKAAQNMLDPHRPGVFNQAVMELGALVCRPRQPACSACPLNADCRSFPDDVDRYPVRTKRVPVPQYRVAIGVVEKNGRLLITRRAQNGLLGGLWEFPGGKLKSGESAEKACRREIMEETGLAVHIEQHLARIRHAYTHFKIVADVFFCRYASGRVHLNSAEAHRWVTAEQLDAYPFPGANRKFMDRVKARMQS